MCYTKKCCYKAASTNKSNLKKFTKISLLQQQFRKFEKVKLYIKNKNINLNDLV